MRNREREIVRKESKIRGGLHPMMDGDRDGDPHWSTGSQDREGCVHPLIQGDWSNESSPRPAGLGLNEHVIKPNSLNVADMGAGWALKVQMKTEKSLTMALGLVSSAWTGFLGSWSVWMLTFLDLEGGGRKLDFLQGRKPWLLLRMVREEERERGEREGIGRRGRSGNSLNK